VAVQGPWNGQSGVMTGTLALIGGEEFTDGCDFDRQLLTASGGTDVVVIPTASAYEAPGQIVDRAERWFSALGASVTTLDIYRRADALDPARSAALADARLVYLTSGSPMHLRSVLKDTPLWDQIVGLWRRGGVLAGSAEGATVLSSHMVDPRGGAFTVGLDLLTSVTVIPRYDLWSEDKWHRTVRLAPSDMTVLGIEQRTAVFFDGDAWTAHGAGSVMAYRDGDRVELTSAGDPTS
jgi:cyanophycinase